MSPLADSAHFARSCLTLNYHTQRVGLARCVRSRLSTAGDLGKRVKKVLTAVRKVLPDIRIMLNFSCDSFYPSSRTHMNRT